MLTADRWTSLRPSPALAKSRVSVVVHASRPKGTVGHLSTAMVMTAQVGAACLLCLSPAMDASAARGRLPPPTDEADRCTISALDKFADTRAKFSLEASGGNMVEALVDVRDCDLSSLDLSTKVLSGVRLQGANLSKSKLVGSQMARAEAQGADLSYVDFTDANCYGTNFDGANLEGAQFENSILTGATFGKTSDGSWANLKAAHFEGALLSSSDIERMCANPTLEDSTKKFELGCRSTR